MKLTFLYLFLLFFISIDSNGQNDPEAVKILDSFSSAALEAPSVSMKFILITNDQMEGTHDTLAGSIIMSKNKYKLDLPDNIIWFNGETSWSYLPAEKEVTITKADRKDKSFQSRPSEIFSMYKSGYKCRLIEEKQSAYVIDLYPEDAKSDLIRVRLVIGKSLKELRNLEYKKKDGLMITLIVSNYNLKEKPDAAAFVFQHGKYKDAEVIDMR